MGRLSTDRTPSRLLDVLSVMTHRAETGGSPHVFIRCVECEKVFLGRRSGETIYPIATDGTSGCGGDSFQFLQDHRTALNYGGTRGDASRNSGAAK